MNNKSLKLVIRELLIEVLAEKAKKGRKSEKKPAPPVPTPEVPKADLDQTKDTKIDAGDAVVASRKAKIAMSKGDKKDAAYYEKIRKIINRRIGQKAD